MTEGESEGRNQGDSVTRGRWMTGNGQRVRTRSGYEIELASQTSIDNVIQRRSESSIEADAEIGLGVDSVMVSTVENTASTIIADDIEEFNTANTGAYVKLPRDEQEK